MAALHSALTSLGPTSYSTVPRDVESLTSYLQNAFRSAQTIIDSVPLPPPSDSPLGRSRSSTSASTASNVSEISSSSARSDPLDPGNAPLQKEWGKPIKLNAKDNPLDMSVYKLGGKDGKGAWFARRSVHEGLGFKKWKLGLQREFPESLKVQGGPGEGNIRGIGGERRVEKENVEGVGAAEVYHLSAQFPGPTTPRDFVTLLLTSSTAVCENADDRQASSSSETGKQKTSRFCDTPRHFMVISKPCLHPDCPPRDGFIRGQYESVEFIREIPKRSRKSASTTDLPRLGRVSSSIEKGAILRNATNRAKNASENADHEHLSPLADQEPIRERRQRGKTISFAGSRGTSAKGEKLDNPLDEDDESNPVEWIMITRSDPGGSVPRFMVERGTPGSIVADASKFLDWACKQEYPNDEVDGLNKGFKNDTQEHRRDSLEAYRTNGHLAGLDGAGDLPPFSSAQPERDIGAAEASTVTEIKSGGLMASMTSVAFSGIETYAPQAVIDRLPNRQPSPSTTKDTSISNGVTVAQDTMSTATVSPASSIASFASAEDRFEDAVSTTSGTSLTKASTAKSPHERELDKLNERKKLLNEKLAKAKEKETKDKEELTAKEEDRVRKAEEKHAKEIAKQEEKYKKEVAKLDVKRQKEEAKEVDRKRKAEEKDEKTRLTREKDEMKQQLEMVCKERDILKEQVGALQKENTSLVVRLGKFDEGKELLKEVKAELKEGSRSRSGSFRRIGSGTPERGREAMVLAKDKVGKVYGEVAK